MRARPIAVSLVVVQGLACAAGGSPSPVSDSAAPDRTVRVSTLETVSVTLDYVLEDNTVVHSVPSASADLLAAMLEAFEAVGLPVPSVDVRLGAAFLNAITVTGRIGEYRLSRLLSCGQRVAGAVADAARVEMTLYVEVLPEGETESTVRSTLEAVATPFDSSTRPRACTSTRRLEAALVEAAVAAASS